MKPIIKNQGVIIKTKDYKDSSKIITILTKEGLIDLILKGTTSMNSGNKKYTIPPVMVEFLMTSSTALGTFTEGYVLNNFTNVKLNLEKNFICMAILEKVITFSSHIDEIEQFYYFVIKTLEILNENEYSNIVLNIFEIKLLYLLGISPAINYCNICGEKNDLVMSLNQGGVICKKCANKHNFDLNINETELFKYLYLIKLDKIDEKFLEIIDSMKISLDHFIDKYYEKYIDFYSTTKKIIKKVS